MIGNIVASSFSGHHTRLQLALALLVDSKKINEHLKCFGVTSTPKECRRFKISAANAVERGNTNNCLDARKGLIQVVSDNFDAKVHSQNGLTDTHGLASIVMQQSTSLTDTIRHHFPLNGSTMKR